MGTEPGSRRGSLAASAAVYVVLFVLGAFQGLIGSFQYGQSPVPVIAILLDVIILATCLLGAWGTMSPAGALAPATGWIIASFILSMGTHEGTVIITNTTAGKWYLYGGALAAAIGAASGFIIWLRAQARRLGTRRLGAERGQDVGVHPRDRLQRNAAARRLASELSR